MPFNAHFNVFFLPYTVEKMKMIDKEYEGLNHSGEKWFSFQSKLAPYRKEMEAQMQAEMNTKVCIFFYKIKSCMSRYEAQMHSHIYNKQCL